MKHIAILFIILNSCYVFGQSDSFLFESKSHFKNGIYTTNEEVLRNDPKYPGYMLGESKPFLGERSYYYFKDTLNKLPYNDDLFAVVFDGNLFINYQNRFHKLILTGAISTFYTEVVVNYSYRYYQAYDYLYFVDLMAGTIGKLKPGNIDYIMQRDHLLYSEYSNLPDRKKKKVLYSFVLKYNSRNPIYIQPY